MLIEALLSRIDTYVTRSGRREGGVSADIFSDGQAILRLRQGRSCTVRSLERAHARLDELFSDLDAAAAMRGEAGRLLSGGVESGGGVHPGNLAEAGSQCDRNAAGQLRREGVS